MPVQIAQLARVNQFGPPRYRQEHILGLVKEYGPYSIDLLIDLDQNPRSIALLPSQTTAANLPQRDLRVDLTDQYQRHQQD